MLILSMTMDFSAHRRAVRESFERPPHAFVNDCVHVVGQVRQEKVQILIARVTAVSPIGGWTSRRILVDRMRLGWWQFGQDRF